MAVTALRVHPAETRLTVYRRPYMAKIWPDLPNLEGYANFSGPAGGCSLALAAPYGREENQRDVSSSMFG